MTNSDKPIAKFLRLKTGDDIICEVVEIEEDNEHYYMVINPLKIVYVPSQSGYMSMAFMPWVFPSLCDNNEFVIHYDDVLMISDSSKKMNDYYWDSIDTYILEPKMENKVTQPETDYSEEIEELLQCVKEGRKYH